MFANRPSMLASRHARGSYFGDHPLLRLLQPIHHMITSELLAE